MMYYRLIRTLKKYLRNDQLGALIAQAEGQDNEETARQAGVTREWIRRLANAARNKLAIPEVRAALVSELGEKFSSYYAPGGVLEPLGFTGDDNRASRKYEIAPNNPATGRFRAAWGFNVKSEDDLKKQTHLEQQAEAAMIRRVREGAEILSEEIADLV